MNKVIAEFGGRLETVLHGDHHIITSVLLADGLEPVMAGVPLYRDGSVYRPLLKADTGKSPVAVVVDDVEGPTSASVANVAVHGAVRTEKLCFGDGGPVTQAVVDKLLSVGVYAIGGLPAEAVEPVIGLQPASSTTVAKNEPVTLTVGASAPDGGAVTYRWMRNTTDSDTDGSAVPGGTGSSLSVDTSAAGTSYYYCEVTNTRNNTSKTVKSSVASVEVTD